MILREMKLKRTSFQLRSAVIKGALANRLRTFDWLNTLKFLKGNFARR